MKERDDLGHRDSRFPDSQRARGSRRRKSIDHIMFACSYSLPALPTINIIYHIVLVHLFPIPHRLRAHHSSLRLTGTKFPFHLTRGITDQALAFLLDSQVVPVPAIQPRISTRCTDHEATTRTEKKGHQTFRQYTIGLTIEPVGRTTESQPDMHPENDQLHPDEAV
jgi:hypothetical protein